ncbi:tetratricopeptide repeat protein [Pontibacter oryzae]|uniref:Tetratricopeptide repeat protein n=1 Tax=Pontibacter oryzae TaxID=2304593 RepID=A0A399RT60_9BACT|nr:tetratricopeptide repeat protein [Pontibacter oryzae]RIJ33533.1 tetratricopeptide repeat protein [Pontibacter oryzae]
MKQLLLITLSLFTFCICSAQSVSDGANNAISKADRQKLEEQLRTINIVLEKYPEEKRALLLRSQIKYKLKDYQGVIDDCQKMIVVSFDPTSQVDYEAIWNIGVAYNSMGNFEKARKYFNQGKGLRPADIRLFENIGYGYLQESKLDSAIMEFESMAQINPKSEKAFYGIGRANLEKGKFKKAIEAFDKAIELKSDYALAYQNRGAAKVELQDMDGACKDWQKSLELGVTQIKAFMKQYCK